MCVTTGNVCLSSINDKYEVPQEVHENGWQWRPVDSTSAFAPPFGTIRVCQCGCLVAGGVTTCTRCVKENIEASCLRTLCREAVIWVRMAKPDSHSNGCICVVCDGADKMADRLAKAGMPK